MTIRPFANNYLVKKLLGVVATTITHDTKPDDDLTTMGSFINRLLGDFVMSVRGDVRYGYDGFDPVPADAYVHNKDERAALLSLIEKILDTINGFKPAV